MVVVRCTMRRWWRWWWWFDLLLFDWCYLIHRSAVLQVAYRSHNFLRRRAATTQHTLTLTLIAGQLQPNIRIIANRWYRVRFGYISSETTMQGQIIGCEVHLLAKDGIYLHRYWSAPHLLTRCDSPPWHIHRPVSDHIYHNYLPQGASWSYILHWLPRLN